MNFGIHALRRRRRSTAGTEQFPHSSKSVRYFDYFMYFVGAIAPLALLPQIIQLFVSHNAAGISVWTWLLLAIMNIFWILYGIIHKDYPVLVTNLGIGIFDLIIVAGVVLFS
jgi:uncharacterized protein with PQ loop repeat